MADTPPPAYGTRRRTDRATTGRLDRAAAAALGINLYPWQRHVLDVAGEIDPATGLHAYSTVRVSVGRRAGKSLLALTRSVRAIAFGVRARAWYTAQSRADAALILREEWAAFVEDSPVLADLITVRRSNGSEALIYDRSRLAGQTPRGGAVRVFAPTRTALHGQGGDLILFDEAWSFSRDQGAELVTAARPLTMTRPGAQVWTMSAAGDVDSTWWSDLLEEGRAAAAADLGYGIAHFEWTADVPGVDLDDPNVWHAAHPATTRHGGPVTDAWLRDEHARDRGDFARTVLNITDRAGTTSAPIDLDAWQALETTRPAAADRGDIVLGVDCSPDQASTAIVAAYVVAGALVVDVVDYRPGHTWAPARCADLYDTWNVAAVALDGGGQSPASVLARPLETAGLPVHRFQLADVTAAAADLVAAARTGQVRNVPHPALDAAVAAARRRRVGDGSWTWGRRDAEVDVAPLIAATFARWAHPATLGAASGGIT